MHTADDGSEKSMLALVPEYRSEMRERTWHGPDGGYIKERLSLGVLFCSQHPVLKLNNYTRLVSFE